MEGLVFSLQCTAVIIVHNIITVITVIPVITVTVTPTHTDHDDHGMQYLLAAVHSERCRGLQQLGGGGRLGVLQVGVRAPATCYLPG